MTKPVVLMILDGYGIRAERRGNAIARARTPNLDMLFKKYGTGKLDASGVPVGLPKGIMGNSEVGHLNIGAGRTVYQDLVRINKAIKDKSFYKNNELLDAITHVKKNNSSLHFIGLLSDGQVHSHIEHLFALMKMAKQEGLDKDVFLHAFLDGRDTRAKSAGKYIRQVHKKRKELGLWMPITTIMGRYYAMDRDNRWKRGALAYDAMVYRKGIQVKHSLTGLKKAYERGESDEFVRPTVTDEGQIKDGDAIIFFNFRSDRARQTTRAFIDLKFNKFKTTQMRKLKFVSFTDYDKSFKVPVAFPEQKIKNTLAEWLSKKKIKQFHTAETEKYAHVTFFFNGGREKPWPREVRKMIQSPKVATYDLKPEMSAHKVKEAVLKALNKDYGFIVVNFANCDMVGHTGIMKSAVKAVETVDECAGIVVKKILEKSGKCLIIADHGNAEEMIGAHKTSHTTNPVPCCYINSGNVKLRKGCLGDVAPTILKMMKIPKPKEMTGKTLI